MRRCLDCNAELPDVAMKCSECGSENLSFIDDEQESTYKEKKSFFLLYVIIAAVIVASIAGVIVYKYISKTVPAKPVESGLYSLMSGDCDAYVSKMNKAFQVDVEEELTSQLGSYAGYQEDQKKTLSDTYGDDYKIDTEVVDVYEVSDIMVAAIASNCTNSGYNVDITDAKYVTVRIVVSNEEGLEDYSYQSRYSIEIDGKWYLYQELTSDTSSDASSDSAK